MIGRCLLLALCCAAARSADFAAPDYTRPVKSFPSIFKPYEPRRIPPRRLPQFGPRAADH